MMIPLLFCSTNVLAQGLVDTVIDPIVEELVYLASGQCDTVKRLTGVAYDQFKEKPDLSNLTLVQITPNGTTTYKLTSLSTLPSSASFKQQRPVIIFIHGYTKSPNAPTSLVINNAFQYIDVNFYLLNASQYIACCNYPRATTLARFVGEALGAASVDLIQAGVNSSMIYIIGHSLGAHIAGFAGSTVISSINQQLGRITGLDPALPCFDGAPAELRLSGDDANYVDVIHTDAGVLGSNMNLGDADYWPNDGDRSGQPGCYNDTCAHARSCYLFAASVINQTRFPAYYCSSWNNFVKGNCFNNKISYMGYGSEPGTTGTYYLRTDNSTTNDGILATILKRIF